MKFVEIKESDYAAFVRDQPQPNFWQSVDMMHLREMRGWSIAYVGVHHQDRLIAVAALSKSGALFFYCASGSGFLYRLS